MANATYTTSDTTKASYFFHIGWPLMTIRKGRRKEMVFEVPEGIDAEQVVNDLLNGRCKAEVLGLFDAWKKLRNQFEELDNNSRT